MDARRLVKFSRDNITAGRRSPGRPKRKWSDLIPLLKQAEPSMTRRRRRYFLRVCCCDAKAASFFRMQQSRVRSPTRWEFFYFFLERS